MRRGVNGLVCGPSTSAVVWSYTGHPELSVSAGALVAITIWFWAWGRISQPGVESGGRRG